MCAVMGTADVHYVGQDTNFYFGFGGSLYMQKNITGMIGMRIRDRLYSLSSNLTRRDCGKLVVVVTPAVDPFISLWVHFFESWYIH